VLREEMQGPPHSSSDQVESPGTICLCRHGHCSAAF
jgi:hypothetical protein